MIQNIFSSLASFKALEFKSGLNVLVAQKEVGATDKQTRNRAGKTSLVETIHFLTGSNAEKGSLFRSTALEEESFGMTFDLGGQSVTTERSGKQKAKINVAGADFLKGKTHLSNSEWVELLGEKMFSLHALPEGGGRAPTFRSLFAYFVRRQLSGAFTTPEKQATMQQAGDYQVALLFLLGLDWKIASDWQKVRDREKTLAELKKAAGAGAFGSIIGKAVRSTHSSDRSRSRSERTAGAFGRLPCFAGIRANWKRRPIGSPAASMNYPMAMSLISLPSATWSWPCPPKRRHRSTNWRVSMPRPVSYFRAWRSNATTKCAASMSP